MGNRCIKKRFIPPTAHAAAASSLTARHANLPKADSAPITLYPITKGPSSIPRDLLKFLHAEFTAEIMRGATYPFQEPIGLEAYASYWFGTFAVVVVFDEADGSDGLKEGRDWEKVCLGTFNIKPNYPGMYNRIDRDHATLRFLSSYDINTLDRSVLSYLQCWVHLYHCCPWQGCWASDG